MASSDEESDEEESTQLTSAPIVLPLLGLAAGPCSESDDDEADSAEPGLPAASAGGAAAAAPAPHPGSNGRDKSGAAEGGEAAAVAPAPETSSQLLSVSDALGESGPDFLRVDAPDFDASAGFKPPPAELEAVNQPFGPRKTGARSGGSWLAAGSGSTRAAEDQRYASEFNFGRLPGQVRVRGSMCYENDDERGRRVRYGAHAMLAADPWSACNPNFAFDDASVTRGKDRSHKKQRGDGNQRNQPARASFVGSKRG